MIECVFEERTRGIELSNVSPAIAKTSNGTEMACPEVEMSFLRGIAVLLAGTRSSSIFCQRCRCPAASLSLSDEFCRYGCLVRSCPAAIRAEETAHDCQADRQGPERIQASVERVQVADRSRNQPA